MTRRNLHIDDELWEAAKEAADKAAPTGEPGNVSAWIRVAMREKLERDGEANQEER